jgi:hypothetical protein
MIELIGCACDVPSHSYTLPFALNVSDLLEHMLKRTNTMHTKG